MIIYVKVLSPHEYLMFLNYNETTNIHRYSSFIHLISSKFELKMSIKKTGDTFLDSERGKEKEASCFRMMFIFFILLTKFLHERVL